MGAAKPEVQRRNVKTRTSTPLPFIGVVLLLAVVALFQPVDSTEKNNAPELSPKDEAKLEKRLKEIDDAQQYALIANENGWYACNHPGRVAFYLLAGQVWKYGTTTKGQFGRYSVKYLEEINVSYVIQFQGTIGECLKEEQRKLFNYPYLPENLARTKIDRLSRPPYNSKMQ